MLNGIEILIGSILSFVAIAIFYVLNSLFNKLSGMFFVKKVPPKPYAERLSELTSSLVKASSKVDSVLREISLVASEKEETFKKIEVGLATLEQKEKELKQQVEALQKIPLPVAEYFAKLVKPGERRSALRDYILFGAGVLLTTIITLVLQAFSK